jgi:non-specific serine/threonine protein kinase
LNDINNIEREITERKNKLKKNTNNKNWMKIRKIYKNRYVYKIPYRHLYNLNDDFMKIIEQKLILIINRYYYDHLFIKAIKSYFNLNIRKLYIKWNNKRKKANQSINNISNIINFENIINNKSINEESIEFNINNEKGNKNNKEIVNESISINKIDELFNFNETNNYEISELSKNNVLDNNLDILNNNNLKNNSLYSKSKIKLENNLKLIKLNSNIKSNNNLHQRYEDEDDEDQKIKDNEEILKEKNNSIIKNKNNIFDVLNTSMNFFSESIYSRKINKKINNINSMLDQIDEINKGNSGYLFSCNNVNDYKNNKRNENNYKISKKADFFGRYQNDEKNDLNYFEDENKVNKGELLEKILLDYNSKLREIKN